MTSYLIHERMNCEVTFVKRVEADDEDQAFEKSWAGDSDLLGVAIGDSLAGGENEEIFPDEPHYLPAGGFYPEPAPHATVKMTILWGDSPEPGDASVTYTFATQGEADAFMSGVEAMDGWMGWDFADEGYVVPEEDEEDEDDAEV